MQNKINKAISEIHLISGDIFHDIIKSFYYELAHIKQSSDHTVYNYILDIKSFLLHFKIKDLSDLKNIDTVKVTSWLHHLSKKHKKNASTNSNRRRIAALKSLLKYINEYTEKPIALTLISSLESPKKKEVFPKNIEEYTLIKFLDGANKIYHGWELKRNIALIKLLASTGMRISEALSLTLQDIAASRDFISIKGKGNKERVVPIMPEIKKELIDYIKECPIEINIESKIFINKKGAPLTSRMVQLIFNKISHNHDEDQKVTPHMLRHSFATMLLQNSKNNDALIKIQKILGHSNLSTTQIYLKMNEESIKDKLDNINYNNI